MANHVSSSAFTDETVYPSSDASEYPFWDVQCEQFPWTSLNAINNYEPLLNMDFDPFWNFEHNLERLTVATALDPLRMDGIFLPSTSAIPIEGDITPNLNAVAVEQDTTTEPQSTSMTSTNENTLQDLSNALMHVVSIKDIYEKKKTNECNNRLIPLPSGEYECKKCLTIWTKGIDKYNLKLQVEDANGNAKLKLVDKDCIQLIGKTASDLRAKHRRITPQLPKEIQSLVGLAMLFMVEVKREQLENRYAPFSVTKHNGPPIAPESRSIISDSNFLRDVHQP
nr:replication factor A protein 1-like [Ipomoea batatas]